MQGWVSIYRELLDKPIWTTSTPEQKTILITLILMANHDNNEWEFKGQKFTVKRGQMITSLESIVQRCGKGVTMQNVRTALKRFEKYGFLTNESTNKNRLITIVNYGLYQHSDDETNKQTNKQLTSNQQATNKQLTTNNNVNKEKEKEEEEREEDSIIDLLIKNNIVHPGGITYTLSQDLDDIENHFGFDNPREIILSAINDAARGNGRTWKFVYNKLNTWRKLGVKSLADLEKMEHRPQEVKIGAHKKQNGVDKKRLEELLGDG